VRISIFAHDQRPAPVPLGQSAISVVSKEEAVFFGTEIYALQKSSLCDAASSFTDTAISMDRGPLGALLTSLIRPTEKQSPPLVPAGLVARPAVL
jgi:hypothetical protein